MTVGRIGIASGKQRQISTFNTAFRERLPSSDRRRRVARARHGPRQSGVKEERRRRSVLEAAARSGM